MLLTACACSALIFPTALRFQASVTQVTNGEKIVWAFGTTSSARTRLAVSRPWGLMVMWDMGSPFYSKWTVMQWTHPSSLRTTQCKVCKYAGRLWHLYWMLQELSELYSYFEIQKWTYAVTCRGDCFRLLAGRCMNVCHGVWSLSTVIPILCTTNTRSCSSLET